MRSVGSLVGNGSSIAKGFISFAWRTSTLAHGAIARVDQHDDRVGDAVGVAFDGQSDAAKGLRLASTCKRYSWPSSLVRSP
jgi:hypothetical protein